MKPLAGAEQSQETETPATPTPAPSPTNQKMVTMVGPLAEWMGDSTGAKPVEERHAGKLDPSDHIALSPVGSSTVVVRKTFGISTAVNFPFEIPAHAVTAQLRGTYRSFVAQQSVQASDESADVAFLLMNEEQYATFIKGGSPDVLMNLEPSHAQDVNFGLPASRELPVKYHLVFRNNPGEGKKIIQADFHVDF